MHTTRWRAQQGESQGTAIWAASERLVPEPRFLDDLRDIFERAPQLLTSQHRRGGLDPARRRDRASAESASVICSAAHPSLATCRQACVTAGCHRHDGSCCACGESPRSAPSPLFPQAAQPIQQVAQLHSVHVRLPDKPSVGGNRGRLGVRPRPGIRQEVAHDVDITDGAWRRAGGQVAGREGASSREF